MLCAPPQIRLLLVFAAVLLAGLAVREWRAGFPDLADRLERFDRAEPPALAPPIAPRPARVEAPAPPNARTGLPTEARREPTAPNSRTPVASGPAVPSPAGPDPRPLDLNRATVAELARLTGLGPGLAQRIVEERQLRGRFDSPEALRHVVGLGPKKLAALRDLVIVEAIRE